MEWSFPEYLDGDGEDLELVAEGTRQTRIVGRETTKKEDIIEFIWDKLRSEVQSHMDNIESRHREGIVDKVWIEVEKNLKVGEVPTIDWSDTYVMECIGNLIRKNCQGKYLET